METPATALALARPDGPFATVRSAIGSDDVAWDEFVVSSSTPSFLQTTGWARVKRAFGWGSTRVVADHAGAAVGAQMLILRAKPLPWAVGYIPRGPISNACLDGPRVAAFTHALRRAAAAQGLAYVRMEPGVEADDALTRELLLAAWHPAPSVQPTQSRIIDLTIGVNGVWSSLRPKWRQYIRHATGEAVRVTEGCREDLPAFFDIIRATSQRTGMQHRAFGVYEAIWNAFAPSRSVRLLIASEHGEPSAALLLIRCGDAEVELYGGMTERGARSRASYLLKWEAIREAAASGLRAYDLWGLPNAGIAHFKAGFGGRVVTYPGAWDLGTDRIGRPALRLVEGVRSRWRHGAVTAGTRSA